MDIELLQYILMISAMAATTCVSNNLQSLYIMIARVLVVLNELIADETFWMCTIQDFYWK